MLLNQKNFVFLSNDKYFIDELGSISYNNTDIIIECKDQKIIKMNINNLKKSEFVHESGIYYHSFSLFKEFKIIPTYDTYEKKILYCPKCDENLSLKYKDNTTSDNSSNKDISSNKDTINELNELRYKNKVNEQNINFLNKKLDIKI